MCNVHEYVLKKYKNETIDPYFFNRDEWKRVHKT